MFKIAGHIDLGLEAWAHFDKDAQVYEIFTDESASCYIGCADTKKEAYQIALDWFEERMSY